jgi:catechol 2,3-dioxygenase-like lactoylglutathione lyase family enzyme
MTAIPIFLCNNLHAAISFYTQVLDFELKYQQASADDLVALLVKDGAELMLTGLPGDQRPAINAYFRVDEVDLLFEKYIHRGLRIPEKKDSPVHEGPIDQSWGMREFYVTDEDGNTLRFGRPL